MMERDVLAKGGHLAVSPLASGGLGAFSTGRRMAIRAASTRFGGSIAAPADSGDTVSDYTALLSGDYWNGFEVTGKPVIVTYSFPTSAPAYDATVRGFTSTTVNSFQAFNANEQLQAQNALSEWAAASGIVFVQVAPGQGDINFQLVNLSTSSYGEPGGIGFYPFGNWNYFTYPNFSSDLDASGDVFMNSQDVTGDAATGTVDYRTLLHEIGHALGLKHPTEDVHDGPGGVDHDQVLDTGDDPKRTIMATVGDPSNPDPHLLQLDKDAAAAIYGASGGEVVPLTTTTVTTGANSVSSWSWNPSTQTLTQTAVTGGETIRGSSVTDVITAMSGNNKLYGLNGNDTLTTGSGNDYLDGGPGNDVMTGGAGNDIYAVDSSADQVIEQVNGGSDTVYAYASYVLPANVETLQLFGAGLTGTGNALANTMYGDGAYGSTLNGGDGGDYIVAGHNNDRLDGGTGDDLLYGDNGNDIIAPGALTAGGSNDLIDGGMGFDTADYSGDTAPLTASLDSGTASETDPGGMSRSDTLRSIEHLLGGSGNDSLTAGAGTSLTAPDLVKGSATHNGGIDQAVDLDGHFRIKSDSNVANSATIPHATIDATSGGESEYYAFSAVDAGDAISISATASGFTPFVTIYDATGTAIASGALTSGSASLAYTVSTPGEYYIAVQNNALDAYGNHDIVPAGDTYTLQVSETVLVDNWLQGGNGNDTLIASSGWDRLDGGAGSDTVIFTDSAAVTASLAAGVATSADGRYTLTNVENLTGTSQNDRLTGDANANVLGGGAGADTLIGGAGNDVYYVDNSADQVVEAVNGGFDTVYASASFNLAGQYIETLILTGSANIDATGNSQANTLEGNAGNNVLDGKGGGDTASFANATVGVTASLAAGTATGFGIDTLRNIANLTGSAFADRLTGDANANILDGGAGIDTMTGGAGNDIYYVDNSADKVIEALNGGNDIVYASASFSLKGQYVETLILTGAASINATGNSQANTLEGNAGNNILDGAGGGDTASFANATGGVTANIAKGTATGFGTDTLRNIANLTGSAFADTLTGDANANVLDGGAGADTMAGGAGDDIYYVDNSADKVTEALNGGNDTVYASASFSLKGQYVETLILTGSANINATGNSQANTLEGNAGDNILDGAGGSDTASFANATAGVTASLAAGTATGFGSDTLKNIANLTGSGFADTLTGDGNANILDGGAGTNSLTGNGGADIFLFDTALGTGNLSNIADFSVGQDLIELDRAIFGGITTDGMLAANAFSGTGAAQSTDTRIVYNSATGDIFYDPDGTSGPQTRFAHVAPGTALTASSFAAISAP